MHDFVRDTVRAALMKARPAPQFTTEIHAHATASSGLTPGAREWEPPSDLAAGPGRAGAPLYEPAAGGFALQAPAAAANFRPLPVRRWNRSRGERRDSRSARTGEPFR